MAMFGIMPFYNLQLAVQINDRVAKELLDDPWAMLGASQKKKDPEPAVKEASDQDPMAFVVEGRKAA